MAVYSKKRQYELISVEVPCPICLNNKAQLLYSISSEQATAHIFGKSEDGEQFSKLKLLVENLWQGENCDFVRCNTCQYCYAVPFIPGDEELYALAYNSETSYQPWKWEYQETYDVLHDLAHRMKLENINLLEIGAGNGAFVKMVSPSLLPKENIFCTEYSEAGKRSLANYGVSCVSQDVRELDLAKHQTRFDVVCMFQVLEHMDNLDTLFECLNQLTKGSAILFIAVPNDKRREFFDRRGIFEDVPPFHVGRYNRVCFETLAKRHGWQIIQHKIEPQSFVSKVTSYIFHALNRSAFSAYLDQNRNRFFRRITKAIVAAIFMAGSLPTIYHLRSGELGVAQWVCLEKI